MDFKRGLLFLVLLILISFVYAHEEVQEKNLDEKLRSDSLLFLFVGSLIISITAILSILLKNRIGDYKRFLFLLIIIPIILVSSYLVYATLYLNINSETKGPVHWHADFEIWNCGKKVDLINPEGFSNRVGTSVFHEHGDNRIHVEGVVIDEDLVDLHNFFKVLGGKLTSEELIVWTNVGLLELRNGNLCNEKEGKLQAFLYKIKNPESKGNWVYEQIKLENFENYVLSAYSNVPPGDCIIIEFDEEKGYTKNICETYKITIQKGDLVGS